MLVEHLPDFILILYFFMHIRIYFLLVDRDDFWHKTMHSTFKTSNYHNNAIIHSQAQSSPASSTTASSSAKGRASPDRDREYDDPEAFRNNSIACLRAKAQEHQARLLNNNLLLQVMNIM